MAKGYDPADWTVMHAGVDGAIRSGEYRERFRVDRRGVVQIIWRDGPEPRDAGPVEVAAQQAIEAAIRPRM